MVSTPNLFILDILTLTYWTYIIIHTTYNLLILGPISWMRNNHVPCPYLTVSLLITNYIKPKCSWFSWAWGHLSITSSCTSSLDFVFLIRSIELRIHSLIQGASVPPANPSGFWFLAQPLSCATLCLWLGVGRAAERAVQVLLFCQSLIPLPSFLWAAWG